MENKIALSLFFTGLFTALAAIIITAGVFRADFIERAEYDLRQTGSLLAAAINETDDDGELSALSEALGDDIRVTLIDGGGTVIFDNASDPSSLDNHSDRPEFSEAVKNGSGTAVRRSDTLNADVYYYAVTIGNGRVLRVAVTIGSISEAFAAAFPMLFVLLIALMAAAVAAAIVLTRLLLRPIRSIASEIDNPELLDGDKRVARELVPFVAEIQGQRAKLKSQLYDARHMKQEFTANVTHELKTPLTSISGYAELIENGVAKAEDIKGFAAKIRREASRLLTLISDIIRLSELDEPVTYNFTDCELDEIAASVVENLTLTAKKYDVEISANLSPCIVRGDESMLGELIYNLCDNAIRYNRKGGRVTVTVGDGAVKVSDTGIGISPEYRERIFERFFRVDKSRSRSTGGTGLGLSIVRHIAELHNAEINLESALGVGTVITVKFG